MNELGNRRTSAASVSYLHLLHTLSAGLAHRQQRYMPRMAAFQRQQILQKNKINKGLHAFYMSSESYDNAPNMKGQYKG